MPINNFKPFSADVGANVTSQADYEALPALKSGFTAGKASSAQVNKAIRQGTFIASAIAQFVADKTGQDVLDNGDVNGFVTKLVTGLSEQSLSRTNPFADIKSDGAQAVSTALANLGLGTAAKKEIGTGTGQIPDMSSFSYVTDGGSAYGFKFPSLNTGGAIMMQTAQVNLPVGITDITLPYAVPNAVISVVTSICNGATQPSNGTVFAAIITAANKIRFINWGTLGITVQYQAWCK